MADQSIQFVAPRSFYLKKDDSKDDVFVLEDIPHYTESEIGSEPVASGSRETDLAGLSPSARFAVQAERRRGRDDHFQIGNGRQEEHPGDHRRRDDRPRDRSASPVVPPYYADDNSIFVPEREPTARLTSVAPGSSRGSSGPRNRNVPRTSTSIPQARADHGEGQCTCPIGYDCQCRSANKLDCRPLVHTFMQWTHSMDQEAYKSQVDNGSNPPGKVISAQRLSRAVQLIDRVDTISLSEGGSRKTAYTDLRNLILVMHVCNVNQQVLDASQILPRMAAFIGPQNKQNRESKKIQDWLCEEITVLYRKWHRGDYSCDPKRGLNKIEERDRNGFPKNTRYTLDKNWAHYVDARYFGEHPEEDKRLVNGQLFYSRQELMRDGVHSMLQAGISGTANTGAYSVVMGLHGENYAYADIDMGDVIEYEGTGNGAILDEESNIVDTPADDGRPGKLTNSTKAMMKSYETGTAIRVIRSFKLAKQVKNKPVNGYRYDGLYRITRKTLQKERGGIWSFRMERLEGQGKLRGFGEGVPSRPSNGQRKGRRTHRNGFRVRA